jgi:prephenate dehydrogenase
MHVQVSIVGLDRISTSFALALKRYQAQPKAQHTFTIIGSDSSAQAMKTAHKLGAIDNFDRKLLKATENADLVVVKSPPAQQEDIYTRLGPALKPGAVVFDMGDLKEPAIAWARQYFPANDRGTPLAYLVGMTPIVNVAGLFSGEIGPEAASATLFDRAEFLITPDPTCPGEAITLAEDVVRLVGGVPRFMDPTEHDGLVAATEQLPTLIGAAVFYALQQSEGWPELRRMVNPTLALSFQALRYQTPADLSLALGRNKTNLARHLGRVIEALDELREALASGDMDKVDAFLTVVGREWEKWDVKRHSGQWEEVSTTETLPGPLGSLGGFLTMSRRKKQEENED